MVRSLVVLVLLAGLTALAQTSSEVTATGYITDTLCGEKGATAEHAAHAQRMVATGKAKYAIYAEPPATAGSAVPTTPGVLYILEPQSTAEQYLGQRVKITGTVSTAPIARAGQSHAPDAVATYRRPDGSTQSSSGTADTPATDPTASSTLALPRPQQHPKALDTATPVAGTLRISSTAPAPDPPPLDGN